MTVTAHHESRLLTIIAKVRFASELIWELCIQGLDESPRVARLIWPGADYLDESK